MSITPRDGATPFGRLRAHYEASDAVCPACGYEDESGGWQVMTTGRRVEYRHQCPSCEAVDRRAVRI